MAPPRRLYETGQTLLEIMVAAAVLGTVLLVFLSMILLSTRVNANLKEHETARENISRMLQYVEHLPRKDNGEEIRSFVENHKQFEVHGLEHSSGKPGQIRLSEPFPGVLKLEVVVTWNGILGQQEESIIRYVSVSP